MTTKTTKKLAALLGLALKGEGYDVPHSVLLRGLAAVAGQTDWQVMSVPENSTAAPQQTMTLTSDDPAYVQKLPEAEDASRSQTSPPIIRLADIFLSVSQLRELEARDDVRVIVEVELNDLLLLGSNPGEFLDALSETITGHYEGFENPTYKVVAIPNPSEGAIALEVSGNIVWGMIRT
jgi:hypothetical protein